MKIPFIEHMKDPEMRERYKTFMTIAWPAALEGALMSLMNSFDTMMVGKLGPAAIAAVGLCAQPRMLLLIFAQSLCVGTTACIARRYGEQRQDKAISTVKQSLVIVTAIGVIMTLFGFFGAKLMVELAGANEETVADASLYFRTISCAYMANYWTLCICAAMRGIGRTRITLAVNMVSNIVNIFFNYCLIQGNFGFPAWGIFGAAVATDIGTCVGCVLAVIQLLRKKDNYLCPVDSGPLTFEKDTLESLLNVGVGSIFESAFMRVGFMINGRLVAGLGTIAYATNQVVQQCSAFSFTLGDGIGAAGTTLVGKSLGEGDVPKARSYIDIATVISTFLSVILIIFFLTLRRILPLLFTDNQEVIEGSAVAFMVLLFGIYSQNKRVVLTGCLRGAGDVKFIAFVSLVCILILRPLLTYILAYQVNAAFPALLLTYTGQWISFDIDAVIRSRMLKYRVRQGGWSKIKV
jgi:putative MATE family efflux protein